MMPAHPCPLPLEKLLEYWLDELDQGDQTRIDAHVLGCAACSERLAEVAALANGIRSACRQGLLLLFVNDEFVRRLSRSGLRLREYRLPPNGRVDCTATADDDLLVSRLQLPSRQADRVDVHAFHPDGTERVYRDVPFRPDTGEVVMLPNTALVKRMPSHIFRLRLVAVGTAGEQVLGEYTFCHTAS
jgi:hypothetical protein